MKSFPVLAAAVFAMGLTGCSTTSTHLLPNTNLTEYKHAFVVHLLTDGHGVDEMIAQEFRNHGYDVSTGPMTMLPDDAQLIIDYQDEWAWDFKNYMIGVAIEVKERKTEKVLVSTRIEKPSMVLGENPQKLIHDLLNPLFKAK